MPRKNLPWRDHVTDAESAVIRASDMLAISIKAMKENYESNYARQRQRIVNRAIKRAKLAAKVAGA